jgi:Tol biopolymer transport system component/DNA-binding winged helix-turn-helix (wHTH) protein
VTVLESSERFRMPGVPTHARIIRFGLYEVDLAARELRRDGAKVKLQDRPFEVLTILIERPGDVVAREEFRQRLWPADTFVDFDSSLNTSINKLRQALSDDAENPRFIATVGRRGYRFIAPTSVPPESAGSAASAGTASTETREDSRQERNPSRRPRLTATVAGIAAILFIILVLVLRFLPQPVPRVLNVVQVSHNEHLDPWGRVKTDGARLFFLERAGGHWNVMQVPASGGEAQLFPEPSKNTRLLDISADRSEFLSFAFLVRDPDLPLSLTPVVGGPSRRVGDIIADDAVFGPDGRRIFFTRPDGIYSCERDGTHVQRLVALTGRSEDPRWSKDGRRLRFTLFERTADRHSIWEVSADGKNLHPVLAAGFSGQECCGEWSADGRYFFFESMRDSFRSVWAVREGNPSWFASAPKPVQLTLGPHSYGSPIPDEKNSRLFVWGGDEQHDLVRYDRESHRVEPLNPTMHSTSTDLSRDGRWLAFPSGGALWKTLLDGTHRQSLASGLAPTGSVRWSPDGRMILFHSIGGTEFGRFFIVSSDGGTPAEISFGAGRNEPEWSPDAKSIVYAKWTEEGGVATAESGVYSVDLETSQISKIPGSEGLIHPSWSPDKRFLVAVTSSHVGPPRPVVLKLFDTRTQSWKDIAQGTLLNPGGWSPDSKYIYYQDILGQDEPVFKCAIGGKKPELFFDFASLLRAGYIRCQFLRSAPNGEAIASLTRSDTDLYRLDLDLP